MQDLLYSLDQVSIFLIIKLTKNKTKNRGLAYFLRWCISLSVKELAVALAIAAIPNPGG